MDAIGSNVRRLRLEAGWKSPLEAYDATGVDPDTWRRIESKKPGPQGPATATLERIRQALEKGLGRYVGLDELVSGRRVAPVVPVPTPPPLEAHGDPGEAAAQRLARRGTRTTKRSPRRPAG